MQTTKQRQQNLATDSKSIRSSMIPKQVREKCIAQIGTTSHSSRDRQRANSGLDNIPIRPNALLVIYHYIRPICTDISDFVPPFRIRSRQS